MNNKNLRIIQFLLNEKLLKDSYVKTVTDICILQAKDALEKELGYKIETDVFKREIERSMK